MVNEIGVVDDSQRKAAKIVGFMYLLLMVTGGLGFYLRSGLIVSGDAAKTAANIVASERLFRISTVIDLLTAAGEAVLAVALYVLLKRVNRGLALLGALWRVTDGAILGVITLSTLVLLVFLSGANYLQVFTAPQLQALAKLSLTAYTTGFTVGFVFLALGALVFSYLLYKSSYVPKVLAAWGMFSYALMLFAALAFIIFPSLAKIVGLGAYLPAGLFEIATGLWLLIKGVDAPRWSWFSTSR